MNPFDLKGPEFLKLYVVVLIASVVVAALLRWALRVPSGEPRTEELDLSAYEIAYLAGGAALAVNAAVARLIHEKALSLDPANRKLKASGTLAADASELERAVYAAARREEGVTAIKIQSTPFPALDPLRMRLQEMGLIVRDGAGWEARFLPLLLMLSVTLFGVVKIFVGISRGRPVVLLVVLCMVSAATALAAFGRAVHRSRQGQRGLGQLRQANAALRFQADRRVDELSGNDLVLSLGLFGLGILTVGPLSQLQAALRPPAGSSCSGSGSGCGGGGCGGGGCGGCGA